MPDDATRLRHLLDDIAADADSRGLAALLYGSALADGHTADEALTMAADALRQMRAEWEHAKQEDGD